MEPNATGRPVLSTLAAPPASCARSGTRSLLTLGVALGASAWAQSVPQPPPHPTDALALLETHCVKCHGGEKTKAGFDLTTREALLRGGESGQVVVPGDANASLLYLLVAQREEPAMPHKEDPLPAATVQEIADWIRAGAPYPRVVKKTAPATARKDFTITDSDRAHWAFQPVRRTEPPAVKDQAWPKNPVDAFILAPLESKGLQPSAPASRATLIRRVTLDLIGLPPTPSEVEAFVRDVSPDAYPRLIDRLLASPHYGERWGRHWLDLARFAESDGFEHDAVRANAWRYRDYVVRSFNADKPYDRFIREQVAGDELYPEEPEALIATAFNLLGPDMVDSADQVQRRHNTLNDMTDTTALAFMGLTVGCARCHDHKFEPIAQRDYYAFQAFFAAAKFRNDLPVPSAKQRADYDAAMIAYNEQTKTEQEQIAALEGPYREKLYRAKLAKLSPEAQAAHQTPKEKRTTEQENQIQETAALVEVPQKELLAAMKKADRDRHKELIDALKPFPKPAPMPASLALQNGGPAKSRVLHRGDYNQPGDEVAPAAPEVLRGKVAQASRLPGPAAGGTPALLSRAPLADWLTRPGHPLTARVMVNRIWQHHFGRGLAPMPSDFGTHGQKPTHPALLDWLASEFVASGWSVKQIHRVMLLSATYQQASVPPVISAVPARWQKAAQLDPDNRFYSRMNRLRLEGEVIRDSLLAISGQLNPTVGGPGVFPPIPAEVFQGSKGWTANEDPRDYSRRSLYIFARRNLRFPFLEVFDSPDSNLSCPSRERSTTAPQSLTLLNAQEVLAAAEHTAARLAKESATAEGRVTLAYGLILGRDPTGQEQALSLAFLSHSPLHELCRALFNLNAFVYAD